MADDSRMAASSVPGGLGQGVRDGAGAAWLARVAHEAGRIMRREEELRREAVDDLLRDTVNDTTLEFAQDPAAVRKVESLGLNLEGAHQVVLAVPANRPPEANIAILGAVECSVINRWLEDERENVLAGHKDGGIVVVAPARTRPTPPLADWELAAINRGQRAVHGLTLTPPPTSLGEIVHAELTALLPLARPWRVTVGRPHPGPHGVARSYGEARDTLADIADLEAEWWTVDDVATYLDVKPRTIHNYRSAGVLPQPDRRVGSRDVWRPCRIIEWRAHRRRPRGRRGGTTRGGNGERQMTQPAPMGTKRIEWNPRGDTWEPATVIEENAELLRVRLDANGATIIAAREDTRALSGR